MGESQVSPVRVMIVDDSPIVLSVLRKVFDSTDGIQVVGAFHDPKEALEKLRIMDVDVICCDYYMKGLNGLEFVRIVMQKSPKPILIMSAGIENSDQVVRLLDAGAIDVLQKPLLNDVQSYQQMKIVQKIRVLSGVKPITRRMRLEFRTSPERRAVPQIIAIGASTGGPQALGDVLIQLPPNYRVPILCIQHISVGFLDGLVHWLDQRSKVRVRIAKDNERLEKNTVYFVPEGFHGIVESNMILKLARPAESDIYCPSINTTFCSIAENIGASSIAILLTGMGDDGALGLRAIRDQQGSTITQSEESCIIYGMPKAAVDLSASEKSLNPSQIGQYLLQFA